MLAVEEWRAGVLGGEGEGGVGRSRGCVCVGVGVVVGKGGGFLGYLFWGSWNWGDREGVMEVEGFGIVPENGWV